MSDKLTNQAAGRLCREMQGVCLGAARTMLPGDAERATMLIQDLLGTRGRWSEVDAAAYQLLGGVLDYVETAHFALAAQGAGRAAQIFEARSATRSAG